MKDQNISITINKPLTNVFAFVIDPKNTPKWIDVVVVEQSSEWPPKVGTMYRSQDKTGEWRELEMTAFEENKMFVLSEKNGFHIKYTFISVDEQATQLNFYLWSDEGELKNFFTPETLEKLKKVIESQ